jgi:lipopolysaccharide/colanic/teichoic acid biosynthesis glycosyltransferase
MATLSVTDSAVQPRDLPAAVARSMSADLLTPAGEAYLSVKASLDFGAALTLLVLTAPLIGLAMVLVKLTSRGPALYAQIRLGKYGQPFTIYKIRTMTHDCESLTGPRWSMPGDVRITALGRWLRHTHLDELPQLWNVLRGDMSLVGPRPERPEFAPRLERAVPHYRKRLQVRPGVTGLAQVQLPADSDLNSVRIKTAYDLFYIRNLGVMLDLRLAWATLFKLVGLSFASLCSLFGLPRREVIERDFADLSAHSKSE